MFCKYCGGKIDGNASFCPACGKKIEVENVEDVANDNPEQKDWYYKQLYEAFGPFSYKEIVEKVKTQEINAGCQVKETKGEWVSVASSPFGRYLQINEICISDIWVWCLAILPISISILLEKCNIVPADSFLVLLIPIVLNCVFIKMDENELNRTGMTSSAWFYIGIFLVPLYLILREIKTNHNFVPAVVWFFVFAVNIFIL